MNLKFWGPGHTKESVNEGVFGVSNPGRFCSGFVHIIAFSGNSLLTAAIFQVKLCNMIALCSHITAQSQALFTELMTYLSVSCCFLLHIVCCCCLVLFVVTFTAPFCASWLMHWLKWGVTAVPPLNMSSFAPFCSKPTMPHLPEMECSVMLQLCQISVHLCALPGPCLASFQLLQPPFKPLVAFSVSS